MYYYTNNIARILILDLSSPMDYNIIDNVLTSVDQVAYLSQRLPGQVRLSQFGFLSIDDFPKVKNISRNI